MVTSASAAEVEAGGDYGGGGIGSFIPGSWRNGPQQIPGRRYCK